jgi:hypothetical protein
MPSNQELERICNIAGYPIYPWAADQLKVRSELGSKDSRNDTDLTYLANKNAWMRVVSSVNLEPNLIKYFNTNLQIGLTNGRSLAESFILYGGTSTYAYKSQKLNAPALGINNLELGDVLGGKTQGMNLRSGLDGYNLIGDKEIKDFGYRPMPGITSITIDSTGRMGSLRQATINFKVWDKYQLDIMDALYFRLGFTVLLEWGHAKYYDNQGRLQSSEELMINPFQSNLTKEDINIALSTNTRKSYGNYGGMLGIVTSFNFTVTQEGGYDCTVKAMSLGSVMGNFAINHVSSLSNFYYAQVKSYLDKEKEKNKKQALNDIEAQRLKAIQEAKDKLQSSPNNWAKLEIRDYLSNVLFNTNAGVGKYFDVFNNITSKNIILEGGSGGKDVVVTDLKTVKTSQTINLGIIGNVNSEVLDVNYYKSRANTLLEDFKKKNNISKSSSDEGVGAYYVKEGVIFFEKGATGVYQKYIADKKSAQGVDNLISVTLDTDYLFNIFSDKIPNTKLVNSDIKPEKVKPFTNYYDRITQENSGFTIGSGITIPVSYKKNGITYSMIFVYPSAFSIAEKEKYKNRAKTLFSDPNTKYTIETIESDINNYSRIVLSANNDTGFQIVLGNKISEFADLGVIKSIDGVQRLNGNSFLNQYDKQVTQAEKDALKAKESKEKELQNEYDTETVKATINSDSTLELMLRSIMLYGINNATNPQLLTGKPYENFIQNLFSEGAYAPFFKSKAPGDPDYSKYTDEFYNKYINGGLTPLERLETNFRYGNNFYLMSGENAYKNDANGNMILKNQLSPNINQNTSTGGSQSIPQVNFKELFKVLPVPYGESADLQVNHKTNLSVYINLGLFFMMLNHTGILYNKETDEKLKSGDVITPMTYVDFNPETNFYLSSINQMSLDPYKFIIPYAGTKQDYIKLFDDSIIENESTIKAITPQKTEQGEATPQAAPTPLFNFETEDKLSGALPQQKKKIGDKQDGYVGKLMYVMVDINYLLNEVIGSLKSASDSNEVFFQSTIDKILADLNKSMGNYNAFRLSYNDNSNCFVITDDQIQMRPDSQIAVTHTAIVEGKDWFEIPIFGKKSIARSFEIRTDISSRLASMIAISSNPGLENQVANAKNTSDFGVYNTGSFDRYIPSKTTDTSNKTSEGSSAPTIELATNFNNVVKSIYGISRENSEQKEGNYISQDSINRARSYYIDKLAKVKNSQPESVHAMIIPLKSSITMDGMAALYPFQLYTIDERILPYRYNSSNLSTGVDNLKKVAFSITKMTHTLSDNQWVTGIEGFMTLLRNPSKDQTELREIKPTVIQITETDIAPVTDTTTNIPTRTATSIKAMPENSTKIYEFFISKGFTKEQAAGFVGNFWQESGLNPEIINSIGAIGIAQWLGPRKTQLLKKNNPYNIETQLNFVIEELYSTEKVAYAFIKSSTTVEQATYNIRKRFERPGEAEANDANRLKYAKLALQNNGKIA